MALFPPPPVLHMLDSWRVSKNSHRLTTLEDMSLAIVLQSETLFSCSAELTYVGRPSGDGSDFKDLSSRRNPGTLCSCGLSSLISNGDNGYFSVVLLGGHHGTSNEGTKHGPSVCLWQAFGADDGETVKPGSREGSQTHTWFLPQCCFPQLSPMPQASHLYQVLVPRPGFCRLASPQPNTSSWF